jgi:hypothetical protein
VSSYRLNVVIGLSPDLAPAPNCAMFDKMLVTRAPLNASKDQMPQALSLPGNTERVYLDVVAQSEANDEFWYLRVPLMIRLLILRVAAILPFARSR